MDKLIKTFENVDAFKEYLEEGNAREELGDGIFNTIIKPFQKEEETEDSFYGVEKLRGYESKDVKLVKEEDGSWRYYVRFTNNVGGDMKLKVYQQSFMREWQSTWDSGTIKLETETVGDMYDIVANTSQMFFIQFDANPDELIETLGDECDKHTKKVELEIPVDTANWTLKLHFTNNKVKTIERD